MTGMVYVRFVISLVPTVLARVAVMIHLMLGAPTRLSTRFFAMGFVLSTLAMAPVPVLLCLPVMFCSTIVHSGFS
jgi:hypothetical protein